VTARSRRTAASEGRLPEVQAPNPDADIVYTSAVYFIGPRGAERHVAAPMADHTSSGMAVYTVRPEAHMLQPWAGFGVFCLYVGLAVSLNWGQWTMRAVPDLLAVRAEAAGEESPRRIQDLLTARQRTPYHSAPPVR